MAKRERLKGLLTPVGMLVCSVLLAVLTVAVGTQENPSKLATSLLQAIALVFATVGSFILGKVASVEAAREVVRPHARSAFRRVQNLYQALGRQRQAISSEQQRLGGLVDETSQTLEITHVQASLKILEYMVIEQIGTADDALEDWRDLVPEEVAKIEEAARKREELDG